MFIACWELCFCLGLIESDWEESGKWYVCQRDRLRENRAGEAKREGFIKDLGHRLPRGILFSVSVRICTLRWFSSVSTLCVLCQVCVGYSTDFLIEINHVYNIVSLSAGNHFQFRFLCIYCHSNYKHSAHMTVKCFSPQISHTATRRSCCVKVTQYYTIASVNAEQPCRWLVLLPFWDGLECPSHSFSTT